MLAPACALEALRPTLEREPSLGRRGFVAIIRGMSGNTFGNLFAVTNFGE